ncbi:MAG: hypothetical protein CVV36_08830 [Candidatus Methanoperedenaceae archaeon HGW-Methanoperedenaceae-1]|nr:MAG: hypothetical protein CVV36_08830 [Candidatus Methanoperedenaceae archaeon HGW-Methanoperedenaceae-1]
MFPSEQLASTDRPYPNQEQGVYRIERIAPPALKGARKSECAPARENSPSGQFSKNIQGG